MSVFGKLRELVGWVLGEDLANPAPADPQSPPAVKRPVAQRRSDGDGFDDLRAAPSRSTVAVKSEPPPPSDEPIADESSPMAFAASLDDLQNLEAGPLEPQPEFVPEGGMSTQSLMQEFESLDPELQAAAVELAARVAPAADVSTPAETSTEALFDEVDALASPQSESSTPTEVAEPPPPQVEPVAVSESFTSAEVVAPEPPLVVLGDDAKSSTPTEVGELAAPPVVSEVVSESSTPIEVDASPVPADHREPSSETSTAAESSDHPASREPEIP